MEQKLIELQNELQVARDRIKQLESRLETAEHQRDRYATTEITLSNGRQLTVAQWQEEVRQFLDEYQNGKTYPANDAVRELERLESEHETMQAVTS